MSHSPERRDSPRCDAVENQSRLEFAVSEGRRRVEARLVNISRGGALLVSENRPPHEAPVWMRIESPVKTDWAEAMTVRPGPEPGNRRPVPPRVPRRPAPGRDGRHRPDLDDRRSSHDCLDVRLTCSNDWPTCKLPISTPPIPGCAGPAPGDIVAKIARNSENIGNNFGAPRHYRVATPETSIWGCQAWFEQSRGLRCGR